MSGSSNGFSRREFLRNTTCGAAAAGFLGAVPSMLSAAEAAVKKPAIPFGTLGQTKYPVTLVSFGAIQIADRLGSRVVKAAIDRGVNLVHTALGYTGGKSIEACGEVFKADTTCRDKVFLCMKSHGEPAKDVEAGLKKLNTDYLDVTLSELQKADVRRLEQLQEVQDKLKKEGKIRHTGFVCHEDMNGVLEMVVEKAPKYFDVVLLAMTMASNESGGRRGNGTPADRERFAKNLQAMRANGVGILSMKSGAKKAVEMGVAVFQPHVKSMLAAGADSILTSFSTFEQVEILKQLDLQSPHMTPAEKKAAADFDCSREGACLMCARCAKVCPQGLPVNDLMRFRMYHEEYGWLDHARDEFSRSGLDAARLASACGDCTACANACPVKLASAATVREVASMFA